MHVIQGEYKVIERPGRRADDDTRAPAWPPACATRSPGVGGMNHFLLPGSVEAMAAGGDATRYGVHLMELLINGLLKQGARRDRLEAKIFGGAKTIATFSNVGEQNARFRAAGS